MSGLIVAPLFKFHHLDQFLHPHWLPLGRMLWISAIALLPFGLSLYMKKLPEIPNRRLVILVLCFIFLSRLIFVLVIDNRLIGDNLQMWTYAVKTVSTDVFELPQTIFDFRALPYFLPMAFVSGGSPLGFQLANVLTITLCAFLVWGITSMLANRRAGLIALLIVAFSPEPLFATETATHDIPGALFLLLVILVFLMLYRSIHRQTFSYKEIVALSSLLGLLLLLMNIQRSLMIFVAPAMVIVLGLACVELWQDQSPIEAKRLLRRGLLFLVAIPFLVFILIHFLTLNYLTSEHFRESIHYKRGSVRWIAAYANSQSVGSHKDVVKLDPYLELLQDNEVKHFAVHKALTDLYFHFDDRPRNYARKLMLLYNLGRQGDEYFGDLNLGGFVDSKDRATRIRYALHFYNWIFSVLFIVVSLASLIWMVFVVRDNAILFLPLLILAFLTLLLGTLGEIQSRYIFSIWMVLPVYIGMMWSQSTLQAMSFATFRHNIIGIAQAMGIVAVFLLGGSILFASFYTTAEGRMFEASEWKADTVGQYPGSFMISPGEESEETKLTTVAGLFGKHYKWRFFTRPSEHETLPCHYSLKITANNNVWKENVLSASAVPAYWQVDGIPPDQEQITLKLSLFSPAEKDDVVTKCRKGIIVEFSSLEFSTAQFAPDIPPDLQLRSTPLSPSIFQ